MFNTSKQHDRFYLTLGSDKSSVSIELKYTYSSLPSIFDDFYLGVKALYKKSIELNLENESIASDELLEKYRALPILDSLEHKYIPKAQFEFGKELIREANMIDIASVDSVIFDLGYVRINCC